MNSIQTPQPMCPREELIRFTNIMQQKPEYFLQDSANLRNLVKSIECNFDNFPKGCTFLANQVVSMDLNSAQQFSASFFYRLTQACFNNQNTTQNNNLNILMLLTKMISAASAFFVSALRKGSFIGKLLAMDVQCFNEDESSFAKALLCASKILKFYGPIKNENGHLSLAKSLIFNNFHIIEQDPCLFTHFLGLLCAICPNISPLETLRFRIPQRLFALFENAKSLPSSILPAVAKLIVRFCPSNIQLLEWLLTKAFKISGGLSFQMTLDAFNVKFLKDNAGLILNAVAQCTDTETMAYFLKLLDHILCSDSANSPTPTEILRWLSTSQLLTHVRKLYFANLTTTSEPVKGAILDFLASLLLKGASLKSFSSSTSIISDKLNSIGFLAEIELNKHLLKKNLIEQQRNNHNNAPEIPANLPNIPANPIY